LRQDIPHEHGGGGPPEDMGEKAWQERTMLATSMPVFSSIQSKLAPLAEPPGKGRKAVRDPVHALTGRWRRPPRR